MTIDLDALESIAWFLAALAAAGFVAWVLWITWLYVHVPRRTTEPPEWVNDGHRPRVRPECWRPRNNWRESCGS